MKKTLFVLTVLVFLLLGNIVPILHTLGVPGALAQEDSTPFAPETLAVGAKVVIIGLGDVPLDIKAAPSLETETRFSVTNGEIFLVIAGPENADGYEWWQIRDPNDVFRVGWIIRDYLTLAGDVPVAGAATPMPQERLDDTKITFIEMIALADLHEDIPESIDAIISPDALSIIWDARDDGLCLYTFADDAVSCLPYPEHFQYANNITWSPDSRCVAFTENFTLYLNESDIWLFTVANSTFTNRADDDVWGFLRDSNTEATIDTNPFWDPTNGDLYFFRSWPEEDGYTNTLQRIPNNEIFSDSEPETVINFKRHIEDPFTIYTMEKFDSFKSAVISPDGKQIALLVRPQQSDTSESIWLFGLEDDSFQQIFTSDDLNRDGLQPEWINEKAHMLPTGVAWVDDGRGLIVSVTDPLRPIVDAIPNVYYYNFTDESLVPLVDFNDIPDQATFKSNDTEQYAPVSKVPLFNAISPNQNALLFTGSPRIGSPYSSLHVFLLPLPPSEGGNEPVLIGTIDRSIDEEIALNAHIKRGSFGDDGQYLRMIIMGILFTFERIS